MIQSIVASPSWFWHELLWWRIALKETNDNQILDIALIYGLSQETSVNDYIDWYMPEFGCD